MRHFQRLIWIWFLLPLYSHSEMKGFAVTYYDVCAWNEHRLQCQGDNFYRNAPKDIDGFKNLRQVVPDFDYTCALDDDGVWCFGESNSQAEKEVPLLSNPRQIDTSYSQACAIDDNGVSCWGNYAKDFPPPDDIINPQDLAVGFDFACVLAQGEVRCWGENGKVKKDIPKLKNPRDIDAGYYHICALDDTGLSCWGYDYNGETSPPPNLNNISLLKVNGYSSCAADDNTLHCWGSSSSINQNLPKFGPVKDFSLSTYIACALEKSDIRKCWGYGFNQFPDFKDL